MATTHPETALVGRGALLAEIRALLRQRRSVLLVGPQDIGKTAIIGAIAADDVTILDPFERVSARQAARVRRAMDRGAVFVAAARSLDRKRLGCVGRIAFRFITVRVPPLSHARIRRLVKQTCTTASIPVDMATPDWIRRVTQLAHGRPGVVVAIVNEAARVWARTARLPVPVVAYLEASIQRMSREPDRPGDPASVSAQRLQPR